MGLSEDDKPRLQVLPLIVSWPCHHPPGVETILIRLDENAAAFAQAEILCLAKRLEILCFWQQIGSLAEESDPLAIPPHPPREDPSFARKINENHLETREVYIATYWRGN